MTLHWSDDYLTIHGGDCREVMAAMPERSVHCVVTSPPYWGLRDYGTATWVGGDEACPHRVPATGSTQNKGNNNREGKPFDQRCGLCGAIRQDGQLGLEATPDAYVEAMVGVFREVRRVLRDDGTVWLNLGDSYASGEVGRHDRSNGYEGEYQRATTQGDRKQARLATGLAQKQLVGIPWRVAFALQADGWYLRSDIIWSKPNPMPESVTDRPTKAHEYLFLLSKSPRYYYDADAVREAAMLTGGGEQPTPDKAARAGITNNGTGLTTLRSKDLPAGRNLRSVWTIATEPYPGAHFATFPRKLVEPCIKAGTSERGVCPECGAPWVRVVERGDPEKSGGGNTVGHADGPMDRNGHGQWDAGAIVTMRSAATTGWRPSCRHDAEPVPATVLDPFAGSGTTLLVAQSLGRRAVGIDLNPDYLRQCLERNRQMPLGMGAA